ncbi:hypothetical protein GLW08_06585 [Pontibacillus yanchengensis]|uniref:Uncharacterized protein n=2 Tax=Pontibacillus yanchengensis TaxID=462910 RepID=A0ACC7VGF2_9BACI|nr:hypothetical protein [Pontibacillus yanchengensis]MYL32423.1 hypothetical protein [Pontibacillus yanchengensis]MYL53004.1 hypothetical protein [Pontibacillus yanchengensis]
MKMIIRSGIGSLYLLLLVSCSTLTINEIKQVEVMYRHFQEQTLEEEYITEQEMSIFVKAINNAKKLDSNKLIQSEPLVSIKIDLEGNDKQHYHLWLTKDGKGYIQYLLPGKDGTYELKQNAVKNLTEFFSTKENIPLLADDIEFQS